MSALSDLKREYEKLRATLLNGTGAVYHVTKLEFQPQALRASLHNAFCAIEVMRDILINKEIISELEYYNLLNEAMEAEIASMENYLSSQHGRQINL